jgi:hypothetical protein
MSDSIEIGDEICFGSENEPWNQGDTFVDFPRKIPASFIVKDIKKIHKNTYDIVCDNYTFRTYSIKLDTSFYDGTIIVFYDGMCYSERDKVFEKTLLEHKISKKYIITNFSKNKEQHKKLLDNERNLREYREYEKSTLHRMVNLCQIS